MSDVVSKPLLQEPPLPSLPQRVVNPTGMHAVVLQITPEWAQYHLEQMPAQRRVNKPRLLTYIRNRKEGRWALHHQGIAFDCQGLLRDGQHRLRMVVATGLATPMLVVYNVPDEGLCHIDENLPRSISDALRMAEQGDYTNTAVAIANVLETYPYTVQGGQKVYRTREEILSVLRRWPDAIDFALSYLTNKQGVTRAVRAVVARAFDHIDHERITEFMQILRTGFPVSEDPHDDSAAILYRNYLQSKTGVSGGAIEIEKYRKGQSALSHFASRSRISKLYGTEEDLFPILIKRQTEFSETSPEEEDGQ